MKTIALMMLCAGCSVGDPSDRASLDVPIDVGMVTDAIMSPATLPPGTSLSPIAGYKMGGSTAMVNGDGTVSIANGTWTVPLSVDVGASVGTITAMVRDNSANSGQANIVNVALICTSSTTVQTLGIVSTAATGAWQTVSVTPQTHVVAPGDQLALQYVPITQTQPPQFASAFSGIGPFWLSTRRTRHAMPLSLLGTVQTPTLVKNPRGEFVPVWRMGSNQTVNFNIGGWEPGETIEDIQVELLGNGTTDLELFTVWDSKQDSGMSGGPGGQLSSTGTAPISPRLTATAWTRLDLAAIAPGMQPSSEPVGGLPVGGLVAAAIILSGGGGDTYLGNIWVTVER